MIRVCIICEGPTEQRFVEDCLYPYLADRSIYIYTDNMAGNISTARIAHFVRNNFPAYDFVTTLVDFYGFKNNHYPNRESLENAITQAVKSLFNNVDPGIKFLPYVQMYEFEGLLFSEVQQFELVQDAWNDECLQQLKAIRVSFDNPEQINNSRETAPSKRLEKIFSYHYNKIEHGSLIAESIGLERIRDECPNFGVWLNWLESLGNQ